MTPAREAFNRLCSRRVADAAELMFGGWPDEEGRAPFRRVTISGPLAAQLKGLAEKWRAEALETADDVGFRAFDSAPQPEDDAGVQFIALDRNAFMRGALEAVPEPVDTEGWTSADEEVGDPRSIVVVGRLSGGGSARFFRRLTPSKQLVRSGRVLGIWRGSMFEALEDAGALLFESDFDCVQFENYLFISKPTGFESLFGFTGTLRKNADATIDELGAYLDPAIVDPLKRSVGESVRMMRRLAGGVRLDLATLDYRRIQDVVGDYGFNVLVTRVGGRLRLAYADDDPSDLIKLLTDSAVKSAITDRKFIATAKVPA